MNRLMLWTLPLWLSPLTARAETIVDFESLPVNAAGFFNGSLSASPSLRANYSTLMSQPGPFGGTDHFQHWEVAGVSFSNVFNSTFGSWRGWSWSNVEDNETPGFGNQYASFPGGGATASGGLDEGGTYAVLFESGYINLPEHHLAKSLMLANTTYSALAARDGNDGSGFIAGAFGSRKGSLDPAGNDFLRVTFTGYDAPGATGNPTGSLIRYLADYRNNQSDNVDAGLFGGADYVLAGWLAVDLSELGSARSIGLTLEGSDVGPLGLNTPAFLAIDNLRITVIPEPSTALWLLVTGMLGWRRSRRPSASPGRTTS